MPRTIHFVALGCPKNRVDAERMVGMARGLGLNLVEDAGQADVIVVNTCGFIESAKEESVEAVLEMAAHRSGRCSCLVMAGCLSQRHPEELARELPEVDHFIGTADLPVLARILGQQEAPRVAVGPPDGPGELAYDRALDGTPHSAYLKIGEGCDRRCSFCIIPALRGHQRSRTVDSLTDEATALAAAGAREICLVAQDTTSYGSDLVPPVDLVHLLEAIAAIDELRWIRLLYAYPSAVSPRLIEAMARLPAVVPYLDLPIQHIDDDLLRRMRRGYSGQRVERLIEELRRQVPGIHLRTTLITGHPGETAAGHDRLLEFVQRAEIDHLGVFPYSREEETHAAAQIDQVPAELARRRADEVMELQQQISRRRLARLRGRELEVLVEGASPESEYLMEGRHQGQAPEVDGVVIIADCEAPPGTFIRATVTDSADYDLVASFDARL